MSSKSPIYYFYVLTAIVEMSLEIDTTIYAS